MSDQDTGVPGQQREMDAAAAAHDAWFRREVEEALRKADEPGAVWVSQEEVERLMADRRAQWIASAAGGRKAS